MQNEDIVSFHHLLDEGTLTFYNNKKPHTCQTKPPINKKENLNFQC